MTTILDGSIAELEEIKEALNERDSRHAELDVARDELKAKDREISKEYKKIEDSIKEIKKAKVKEISLPVDKEVSEAEREWKNSIRLRENKKNEEINRRITERTGDKQDEYDKTQRELRSYLKKYRMPSFCATPFYFSLYRPKTAHGLLTFIITAAICLLAIPILVICLASVTPVAKVFIYIGIVLIFALIYAAGYTLSQPRRNKKILDEIADVVEDNRKLKVEIKKIQKGIINDPDESGYGLEEFDSEIVRNKGIYDNAVAKREAMLERFEKEEEPEIRDEVEQAHAEVMDELIVERDDLQKNYDEKAEDYEAADAFLQKTYGVYIGNNNLNERKINELIEIIRQGKAKNVYSALEVQKEGASLKGVLGEMMDKFSADEDEDGEAFDERPEDQSDSEFLEEENRVTSDSALNGEGSDVEENKSSAEDPEADLSGMLDEMMSEFSLGDEKEE